jgi:hypothetical protein
LKFFFRGTFVEYRTGLINVCPVGRSCSQAERDQFAAFDEVLNTLRKVQIMVDPSLNVL